jgi:hypothetical protein
MQSEFVTRYAAGNSVERTSTETRPMTEIVVLNAGPLRRSLHGMSNKQRDELETRLWELDVLC